MSTKVNYLYEFTLSHKMNSEAFDHTLRKIRNNHSIMSGLLVILSRDFKQILPVVSRGTWGYEIDAYLKQSYLWPQIQIHRLITNTKVHLN